MTRIAIQMDPIGSIKPQSDSTLLLGLEAQKRGHALYYYTPDKLSWHGGNITASAHPIKLFADPAHYYELGEIETLDLKTADVVLLRQDPPFDMAYISTTYILEQLPPKTLVVNNPTSVRNYAEKLFPAQFKEFTPPTLVSADIREIERFRKEYKDIVIKPLYGFGGHSVFRIKADDDNFNALMEMIFSTSKEPWVVQPFLAEVKTGERRIILIGGKFAGVIGRIPAEGDIRSNMRVGGTPVKAELTPKQRNICDALEPVLKEKGIFFAGIDVIGDWLTEINITSPTGIAPIHRLYGKNVAVDFWDAVENYLP
jgi:glutathione synthase